MALAKGQSRIRTDRRGPILPKLTFLDENIKYKCKKIRRAHVLIFCQPIIAELSHSRWIEVFYLLLKYDDENGARRLADLELNGEWASKKVVLSMVFVRFKGIVESHLDVW